MDIIMEITMEIIIDIDDSPDLGSNQGPAD